MKKHKKEVIVWIINRQFADIFNFFQHASDVTNQLISILSNKDNELYYYNNNTELVELCKSLFQKDKNNKWIVISLDPAFIYLLLSKETKRLAAVIYENYSLTLARKHNNLNTLIVDGSHFTWLPIYQWIILFLTIKFEGGRHAKRLKLLTS